MRIGGDDLREPALVLDFQDCEKIKYLLFKWPGLWYFVVTAPSKLIQPHIDSTNIYGTPGICEALH